MKVKPFGKLATFLFLTLCFSGIVFAQDQQWDDLILQLDSEDPAKSSAAEEALIASQAHGSMDALIAILKDPQKDFEKRITVANILGQRRETSVVPELIRLLEEDLKNRTGSWSYLIPTLGMIGDQRATPILLRTLNDRSDDWLGRGMSANALGMIGDRRATGYLINAAWAADTRDDAIQALARIGDPKSAEVLISALGQDEEADTAEAAKQGLIRIGKDATALLEQTLKDRPPEDKDDLYYRRIEEILDRINNGKK